jgi:hypothetical protein
MHCFTVKCFEKSRASQAAYEGSIPFARSMTYQDFTTEFYSASLPFDGSLGTIPQPRNSLCMATDPKTTDWNLLKDRFEAQVHNEAVCSDSIETLFDDHIHRRFGASIAGAVERETKSGA